MENKSFGKIEKKNSEILWEKFESFKDQLVGEDDMERFNSFVQAQYSEEEVEANKDDLAEARNKVQYFIDLEEVKKLYENGRSQMDLAGEYDNTREMYANDLKVFLDKKFERYSDKIKSGYFYKELVKQIETKAGLLRNENGDRGIKSGVELFG